MKKFISCVLFIVLLSLTIYRVYNILSWKDTTGDYLSSTQQLYATEEDLMDVIFVGSSHVYCGIYPEKLWGTYGIAGFNMSISGQDKNSSYHTIKEVLKTQSPKVVLVDMYGLMFDVHGVQGNVYRNMLAMRTSQNSVELVKDYVAEEEQMDYILRWPIIHTRYKELDKYDFVQYEPSVYGRGNYVLWETIPVGKPTEAIECDEIGELGETNEKWLNELYDLSVENDFELVFMVIPFAATKEDQMIINAAKAFADEREIDFLDFNKMGEQIYLDYAADFSDAFHLNVNGANRITAYLGEYLSVNYGLIDNRGDERYWQWDDAFTYYEQLEKEYYLAQMQTIEDYVRFLDSMQHITCVVSLEGEYKESTLDIKGALSDMGITEEEYEAGGTFLYKDGKVEKILDADSTETVVHELNEYDAFKIQNEKLLNEDADNLSDIMLNLEPVGCVFNGATFAVYDDFQKKLINKKGFY